MNLNRVACTLLLTCLVAAEALGFDHLSEDDALRSKRRARDKSSSIVEYMERLRNSLSDEHGKPRLDTSDAPTEVWAMQDTGVLHDTYRTKPKSSERCTAMNQFYFSWRSLSESLYHNTLPANKATLRAYMKVIPKLFRQINVIPVSVDVYMKSEGTSNRTNGRVHAGHVQLSVTAQSASWLEIDILEGVRGLWPPRGDETQVEITVIFRTDCSVSRKVPVIFEDPSTISLSQVRRRERRYALQPLFLVFINDERVKEIIRNETVAYNDNVAEEPAIDIAKRRKRSTGEMCGIEDFEVVFEDLQLTYVYAPYAYNARQCRGSCSHQAISESKKLVNNHAKIMASASVLSQIEPGMFPREPKEPCCVPTKYSPLTLVINHQDSGIKYVVYNHMIVEECECR